jgi:hypothetical protein
MISGGKSHASPAMDGDANHSVLLKVPKNETMKIIAGLLCGGVFCGGFLIGKQRQKVKYQIDMAHHALDQELARPRNYRWWERALGLQKPLSPGAAGAKALFGTKQMHISCRLMQV